MVAMTVRAPEHAPKRGLQRRVFQTGTHAATDALVALGLDRAFGICATIDVPAGGARGVIVSAGTAIGGCSLFIHNRRAVYVHNYVGAMEVRLETDVPVPEGLVRLRMRFNPRIDEEQLNGAYGTAELFLNERLVGSQRFPTNVPLTQGPTALSVGRNAGSPVSTMYESPFPFSGEIISVTFDLFDAPIIGRARH
jgi:arylsulfatase